jgi:threonine-phosphate decarboxylase
MPGIRLGYAVSNNQRWLNDIKESLEPWNVNTAAVLAGCCIFRDYKYIKKSIEWIDSERGYLYAGLSSIDGIEVFKSAANFHLIKLQDKNIDAWRLKELMLKQGILIRMPEGFMNLDGQHVRLAVKDRDSNRLLLNLLAACLRK